MSRLTFLFCGMALVYLAWGGYTYFGGVWAIAPLFVGLACLFIVCRDAVFVDADNGNLTRHKDNSYDTKSQVDVLLGLRSIKVFVGITLLSLGAVFALICLAGFRSGPPYMLPWLFYVISLIAIVVGSCVLAGSFRMSLFTGAGKDFSIGVTRSVFWLLIVIVILGLILRAYNITELPAGVWYDEADNFVEAKHIHGNPGHTPIYNESTNLPSMFLLPVAMLEEINGSSWVNVRLVSIAFSLGFVLCIFLLGRQFIGTFGALSAAFLASTLRWSLNWGRIGMHGITAALFGALTGFLLLRALTRWRPIDFVWVGLCLGFGMWFYTAFRVFPLVVVIGIIISSMIRFPGIRKLVVCSVLLLLAFVAAAAPLLQYAVLNPNEFFGRSNEVFIAHYVSGQELFSAILGNFKQHLLMFNFTGDANPRHNIPLEPMLDPVSGVLFGLGIFIALTNRRNPMLLLLPAWLLIMLLPGIVTAPWESPQSLRSIGALPAVIILMSLPLVLVWRIAQETNHFAIKMLSVGLVLSLLVTVGGINIGTYFGRQASHPAVFSSFSTDHTIMADRMMDQSLKGFTLFASRQYLYSLTVMAVTGGIEYKDIRFPNDIPLSGENMGSGAAIYLEPREVGTFNLLKIYYPNATFSEIMTPGREKTLLYEILIAKDYIEDQRGVEAKYHFTDGTFMDRREQSLSISWPIWSDDLSLPVKYVWETSLHVKYPGVHTFEFKGNGIVTINDLNPFMGGVESASMPLGVGLHKIRVEAYPDIDAGFDRLRWAPPGGRVRTIPTDHLFAGDIVPVGLAGSFYQNGVFTGETITATTQTFYYDPIVDGPYTAVWSGILEIPQPGDYLFHLSGNGDMSFVIDNEVIISGKLSQQLDSSPTYLPRSTLPISIHYKSLGSAPHFSISWTPPGLGKEVLPNKLITPNPFTNSRGQVLE